MSNPGHRESLFEFQGVNFGAAGKTILEDINFVIPAEGITVLVGPSGAGKSTVLRLMNRLEVPSGGRILYRDKELSELDPCQHRRNVAMVFQRPAVFDGTALDNLLVANPGLDQEGGLVALAQVGLSSKFLNRDARELSGGEAQKLCLARSLAVQPKVLLLDEPTSSLDLESATAIEEVARELASNGIPQIWVSHDQDQVARMADRVLRLEGGLHPAGNNMAPHE